VILSGRHRPFAVLERLFPRVNARLRFVNVQMGVVADCLRVVNDQTGVVDAQLRVMDDQMGVMDAQMRVVAGQMPRVDDLTDSMDSYLMVLNHLPPSKSHQ
jgi:hypothetical protein